MSEAGPFEVLEGHHYMHRTTYRRNGGAVPTTVWFALMEGGAYMFTGMNSDKVKRISNNPHVMPTPSRAHRPPEAPRQQAVGAVCEEGEEHQPQRLDVLVPKGGDEHEERKHGAAGRAGPPLARGRSGPGPTDRRPRRPHARPARRA